MAIVTLTGPSASGKSTLRAELEKLGFGRVISHTTRIPRPGEINGVDYHFVTVDEFASLYKEDMLIERNKLGDAYYGVSKQALRDAHAKGNAVIVCEPNGAEAIQEFCYGSDTELDSVAVWVGIDPVIQAKRWMERVMTELAERSGGYQRAVERLGIMLSTEQRWIANADQGFIWSHTWQYDLFLDSGANPPAALAEHVVAYMRTVDMD